MEITKTCTSQNFSIQNLAFPILSRRQNFEPVLITLVIFFQANSRIANSILTKLQNLFKVSNPGYFVPVSSKTKCQLKSKYDKKNKSFENLTKRQFWTFSRLIHLYHQQVITLGYKFKHQRIQQIYVKCSLTFGKFFTVVSTYQEFTCMCVTEFSCEVIKFAKFVEANSD